MVEEDIRALNSMEEANMAILKVEANLGVILVQHHRRATNLLERLILHTMHLPKVNIVKHQALTANTHLHLSHTMLINPHMELPQILRIPSSHHMEAQHRRMVELPSMVGPHNNSLLTDNNLPTKIPTDKATNHRRTTIHHQFLNPSTIRPLQTNHTALTHNSQDNQAHPVSNNIHLHQVLEDTAKGLLPHPEICHSLNTAIFKAYTMPNTRVAFMVALLPALADLLASKAANRVDHQVDMVLLREAMEDNSSRGGNQKVFDL